MRPRTWSVASSSVTRPASLRRPHVFTRRTIRAPLLRIASLTQDLNGGLSGARWVAMRMRALLHNAPTVPHLLRPGTTYVYLLTRHHPEKPENVDIQLLPLCVRCDDVAVCCCRFQRRG